MRTLITFYARTLVTKLCISIIHNRKKTIACVVTMGLTKVNDFLYEKTERVQAFNNKRKIKKVLHLTGHRS